MTIKELEFTRDVLNKIDLANHSLQGTQVNQTN